MGVGWKGGCGSKAVWQLHLDMEVGGGEEQLNLGYLFITAMGGCYVL